jgi:hypothetical protein
MTAEILCVRATRFGFALLENEFAIDVRQHFVERQSATRKAVMWVRSRDNSPIVSNPVRLEDYVSLLLKREYSYLMHDGGIIQIAYIFNGSHIVRHRLAYFPCPFPITGHDVTYYDGGLADLIVDQFMPKVEEHLLLKSPVRFDYAPEEAADYHPASHITINDSSCRIPARAPLRFDTFMKFILENFYMEVWSNEKIAAALNFTNEEECLSENDRRRAYLHWTYR